MQMFSSLCYFVIVSIAKVIIFLNKQMFRRLFFCFFAEENFFSSCFNLKTVSLFVKTELLFLQTKPLVIETKLLF